MAIQKNRLLLTLILILSFSIVNSYAQTTLIVAETFESYDNGSYPNSNGWYNMFSGVSSAVTSERSFWGSKSFKLEGSSNWSRVEAIDVTYDDVILYSVDVFIPNSSKGAIVGFFKKEGNQAPSYNAVMFRNDGTIYTRGTSDSDRLLGNYTSNTWYNVRVSINFSTNSMDFYIDGVLKAQGVIPKPKSYCTAFGISTNNFDGSGTAISYFDNVALLKSYLPPNSPEALLVTEHYLYDFLIMMEAGFNAIIKKEIPSTMTQYKFVNIASYDACNATTRNYVESYVQDGGGVILMGGEPYIFGMSNIAHWFGASSYGNVFGYEVTASISASDPFNSGLSPGTLILDAKPNAYMNGGATIYNLANDSHVIARYNNNEVFAFYHEYQQGRVYYTAGASSPWYYHDEEVYKNWSILLAAAMQWVGRKENQQSVLIEPLVRDHSLHQEFYVDIQIKDAQNLFGVAFKLNFPADKLEALAAEKGDFLGTDPVFFPDINNSAGVVSVGVSKKSGQPAANGTGIVARIKLKEKTSVTSGITIELSLTEVAANDPSGNAITLTPQNTSYVTPGASATLEVSPTSLTLGSAANSQGSFSITSNVSWNVSDNADWLDVSPVSGSGNRTITVTATSANASANPRSATVTVSGSGINRTVSVIQSGSVQTGSYITSVVQNHFLHQEFYVDIQVKDAQNLFGVAFKFNFPADKLEALVAEKGDFLGTDPVFFPDINNSAGVVSVGVSKKSGQPAANGTGIVARIKLKEKTSVTSGITIELSLTEVAANDPSGNAIILTPQNTSYVTPGVSATLDVSPTSLTLGSAANSQGSFSITSNVSWSVSDNAPWLDVSPTSGSGNGTITVMSNSANSSASSRNTTVTVSGGGITRTITVIQLGMGASGACISPLVHNHPLYQEFTVDIQVREVQNLFGVSFKLNFPSDKLEALSAEFGEFLGTDVVFFPDINNTTGAVSVGISKKSGQSGSNGTGVVVRIKLKEKSFIGRGVTIHMSLTEISANDPSGNPISLTAENSSYITSVTDRSEQFPKKYELYPNYPNPFNPTTTISFVLPQAAHVQVQIFDVNGREVKRLVDQVCSAGVHSVVWNGTDEAQQKVSSGIYICRFNAGEVVFNRKLILAK